MNNREVGKKYEDFAARYLESSGYKILEKNFFAKHGEIDIVAKENEYLCFIEVKYRGKNSLATGLYAVDKTKQNRIYNAAKYYLYKNNFDENNTLCRFDVISIDNNKATLIKNAF